MGKSKCFKIIACGSDSVDHDELDASPESKGSSDKRGWSFRKKSAKHHRVLSNSVVSETASGNKDWPESASADLQTRSNSTLPEKASAIQWADEKPQLSTVEKPQVSVDEKARVTADDKPQVSADEKPRVSADEMSQVLADEKSQVPAYEQPQVLTDEKLPVLFDEKSRISADQKLAVPADEKPVSPANEKSMVSSDEKPQVTSDEKSTVTSDEKFTVTSDEKPVVSSDRKPVVSTLVDAKLSELETTRVDNVVPDERAVLVIQTAVRAFLARRAQLKHKNVIKLQAAVRGHLVRRHAVGTLRCVQAIVKMQALVRARHANRLAEGSKITDKLNGKENSGTKKEVTYTSISKLLSNRFARQLLESSPRTKSINVKCDPSKSDSAWKWLERWMSVSSPGNQPSPQPELSVEQHEKENVENSSNLAESKVQLDSESTDIRSIEEPSLSAVPSESDEHLITYETNLRDGTFHSIPTQLKESRKLPEMEPDCFPTKTEVESDDTHSVASVSVEPPETQSKEVIMHGSRKASNPAFIAAQTKFEELSSVAKSTKTFTLPNHKAEDESSVDTFSSITDHSLGARETALSEKSVPHSTRAQAGGSECGTELSISSTLDSPDRSEVETHEFEQELKPSDSGTVHDKSNGYPHIEDDSTNDLSHEEQKPENGSVKVQIEQEAKTDGLQKLSPDASPRSHVTVPESQGTPSSQLSANPKKIKSEKSGSNPKRRIITKKSPSKPDHDPGTATSEQLPKNGKRRNSFGSVKAGHVDQQEARDSSSSNSLPSYMQATESARAKAIANSSPRSSPDVHSKEEYNIKKRHSLPGSNGRHGSPRIQRSLSNAQQPGSKGNGTQSPQERKWQR